MEFRDRAAKETSALIGEVLATSAENSVHELQSLRRALDAALRQVETSLKGAAVRHDTELAALVDKLTAEATARADSARRQASDEARVTIEGLQTDLRQHRTQHEAAEAAHRQAAEKAQATIQGLQSELHQHRQQQAAAESAARQSADKAQATIKALQGEISQHRQHLAASETAARQAASEARAMIDALQNEVRQHRDEHNASAAAMEVLRKDAKSSRSRVAELEHENSERAAMCGGLQTKLDGATLALNRAREQAEAGEQECGRLRSELERANRMAVDAARALEQAEARIAADRAEFAQKWREHALTFLSLSFDRLLSVYGSLAAGSITVDDVLHAVLEALASEFSRVALFKVKHNRLEGVRQTGFDFPPDMSHVAIPRSIDSLLTRAVASGEIETLSAAELTEASGTPFGGTPATVLALPIVVAGEPCAVVYADDADQPHREFGRPELRAKFAELVCEHAAPLLMWLSNAEQALAELSEYATLLLTELEYTWAGDVSAARPDGERRKRLASSLDCARQLFAERARPHGPRAPGLFDERLTSLVEMRRATPFGRDLAALVGSEGPGAVSRRRAAEAS